MTRVRSRSPYRQFVRWFRDAQRSRRIVFPEAMCLSTIDRRGHPDGRMVLLKGVSERGLVFYTNVHSVKGKALLVRPQASLTWYWEPLRRQVRIQGRTELVSDEEADAYFRSRPRAAQLSAWASRQSAPLASRSLLERRVQAFEKRFRGKPVPRPPFWVGFRVVPVRVEFWQERPDRLHDRLLFTKTASGRWKLTRLYP